MARRNSNKSGTHNSKTLTPDGYTSNRPRIRWKEGEKSDLARRVRNAQQKRRRAIKAGVPESALPPAVRGKILRDEIITTRADLKREIANLERFMNADLKNFKDYGYVKITDYELQEAKRLAEIGNKAIAKERARLERLSAKSFGKDTGLTVGQMGNIERNAYQPISVEVKDKERYQWNKYMDMLRKRADAEYIRKKNYQLQLNYVTGLLRTYNSTPYTIKIIDEILKMNPNDFVVKYYEDTDISRIEYIYDNYIGEMPDRLMNIFNHFTGKEFDDFNMDSVSIDNISDKTKWFLEYYAKREAELRQLDF